MVRWETWEEWEDWVDDVQSHNGCELSIVHQNILWSVASTLARVVLVCETHGVDIEEMGRYLKEKV